MLNMSKFRLLKIINAQLSRAFSNPQECIWEVAKGQVFEIKAIIVIDSVAGTTEQAVHRPAGSKGGWRGQPGMLWWKGAGCGVKKRTQGNR